MVERIIEFSARNRFLVLFGVGFALAVAVWSIRHVELDAIPDLSDPQVIVFTEWMGRSPTLIEDQVTYPIVSALVSAPHVTDVRGYSMFGMSFVYVLFEEGTDVYWARSRVLEYMNGIRGRLPEGAEPVIGPDATGIGWVFQYALVDHSGAHGLEELRTFQDFTLRYALGAVPGVAEVASIGGYEKQYQVTVDPDRLRAYGVTLADVITAIRDSNNDVGGRAIELSGREYYVRGRGYVRSLADIEAVALGARGPGGTPILVRDVGTVRFGPDIRRGALEWNGEGETVGAIVLMRYGENALDVIARVKQKLAELQPTFPPGVEVRVAYDRSGLIERSIDTLRHALIEEGVVVSLVIIVFLLHLRSSLLPILSLPVSVALAFIPMYLLGIPSTIMSLGGIAIAIGATVDAEIVMIEASHKKLEHAPPGADRHRLLAEAAKEVTPAIFFSLLIIAVAFLPVFALNGQAGRLFKPLAYTKTFVMLAAALLSITFAPALRDTLIRGRIFPESRHPVSRAIIRVYRPFVYVALRNPLSTIAIGLFALASAIPLALSLGHEFMPPLNEGDLLYMPITFPNISIEQAKTQLQHQDRLLKTFPEVETVFGKVGRAESPTDPAPITMIETTVRLRPPDTWRRVHRDRWYSSWAPSWLARALRPVWPDERPISFDELGVEMNRAMHFPGWTNAWTMPIKTRVDMLTTGIRTPIGIKIFGTDLGEIERVGTTLEHLVAPIRGTRSVLYERNLGGLYVDIIPDRAAIARYGLTVGDVERTIEAAIGGAEIGTTIEGRNRFSINVRYPQDLRSDLDALRRVLVAAGNSGERVSVPLGQLADVRIAGGPPMVRDEDGLLVGYVYVDIEGSRDVGGYVDEAKAVVADAMARGDLHMPSGYFLKWTGQYELLEAMIARMKIVVPLTIVVIVLLLYLHFRNIVEVLIVLLSIPFALVGSVWLMWLLDYRLSTAVWVGVIALAGLAAQTGIVMIVYIDHAYERRKRAGKIRDLNDIIWAHMEGTVMRVRPKLMTVATMLTGLIPLLWATGSGADVMKRIAAPMVGGLLTSAFLTLEIIPVIYTYWRREQLLWERLVLEAPLPAGLRVGSALVSAGLAALVATCVSWVYVAMPPAARVAAIAAAVLTMLLGGAWYLVARAPAARRVWPEWGVEGGARATD
jgi:Cu(I)/Ag(I) efflux system membrane protein CusA/SilA